MYPCLYTCDTSIQMYMPTILPYHLHICNRLHITTANSQICHSSITSMQQIRSFTDFLGMGPSLMAKLLSAWTWIHVSHAWITEEGQHILVSHRFCTGYFKGSKYNSNVCFMLKLIVWQIVHKQMYWIQTNLQRFQPSNVFCNIRMFIVSKMMVYFGNFCSPFPLH